MNIIFKKNVLDLQNLLYPGSIEREDVLDLNPMPKMIRNMFQVKSLDRNQVSRLVAPPP